MKRLLTLVALAASVSACAAELRPLPIRLDAANPDAPEAAPLPVSSALAGVSAPGEKEEAPAAAGGAGSETAPPAPGERSAGDAVYTCPMHPEVERSGPGRCPKCGMDLVPKKPGAKPREGGAHGHEGHGHEGHRDGAHP